MCLYDGLVRVARSVWKKSAQWESSIIKIHSCPSQIFQQSIQQMVLITCYMYVIQNMYNNGWKKHNKPLKYLCSPGNPHTWKLLGKSYHAAANCKNFSVSNRICNQLHFQFVLLLFYTEFPFFAWSYSIMQQEYQLVQYTCKWHFFHKFPRILPFFADDCWCWCLFGASTFYKNDSKSAPVWELDGCIMYGINITTMEDFSISRLF